MENKVDEIKEVKDTSLFVVLWRNITIILVTFIIGLSAGVGLAFLKSQVTYTVTKRVMFVAKYSESGVGNSAGNDMVLAKLYLPNTVDKIMSPLFVADANDIYKGYGAYTAPNGNTPISSGAISASFGEKSLIFTLAYTDVSIEVASAKLKAVIASAQLNLKDEKVMVASEATIREVENRVTIRENNNFATFVVLFAFLGLAAGVAFVLIRKALDDTVKDKYAMEEITGIPFLAAIEDMEEADKRRKEN